VRSVNSDEGRRRGIKFRNSIYFPEIEGRSVWGLAFVGSVKHCVQQVGLDPSGYSGHSFHRGGATLAHRLGIDPLSIKRMGDWSSDACMDYIDPHTSEGPVSLPVAMTRLCAQLG
jgi:hypothetical protein